MDCKFFKKNYLDPNKFGKCSLYPIKIDNSDFLVDGLKVASVIDYHYCSTARKSEGICGKEGKLYIKKKKKVF